MSSTVVDGYAWYYVQVDNVRGYVRGDCVQVCNADGSDLVTAAPGAANTPATVTATPATTAYGYVRLVEDKVNLRTKPAGKTQEQLEMGLGTGIDRHAGTFRQLYLVSRDSSLRQKRLCARRLRDGVRRKRQRGGCGCHA